MANDLENPLPAKWTKKDYIGLAKELGGLAKELCVCGGIIAVGACIGHYIDNEVALEVVGYEDNLFTVFGAITSATLASFRYD